MQRAPIYPMIQALLAAVLFGASAPIAKLLLGEIEPVSLAAFLYLGSGVGILLFRMGKQANGVEAQINRSDWGWLAGAVLAGGVAAPIVLLFGLRHTPAATASLLLNFESVATALIAALIFKEAISGRAAWAVLGVTIASMFLSWDDSGQWGISLGAAGILTACVLWGIDNNLTRHISAKNPLVIVMIKGLGAGSVSLALTFLLGNPLPQPGIILSAMVLGCLSYGFSIVLFIYAMRGMGAARTSALFGTAPLAGVALSFILFQETPSIFFGVALLLMVAAAILLLNENHSHFHVHETVTHEHSHRHDDSHHTHEHAEDVPRGKMHSHVHTHLAVEHDHAHMPDSHHEHAH